MTKYPDVRLSILAVSALLFGTVHPAPVAAAIVHETCSCGPDPHAFECSCGYSLEMKGLATNRYVGHCTATETLNKTPVYTYIRQRGGKGIACYTIEDGVGTSSMSCTNWNAVKQILSADIVCTVREK